MQLHRYHLDGSEPANPLLLEFFLIRMTEKFLKFCRLWDFKIQIQQKDTATFRNVKTASA